MTTPAVSSDRPLLSEISEGFGITLELGGGLVLLASLAVVLVLVIWFWRRGRFAASNYNLNSAEFGIGGVKATFKPDHTDRQVAYAIWVELSTRKIGLEIDLEHDVISEIYDSWYQFFSVTRNLIKKVPAHKLKNEGTKAIVRMSVLVLNEGLRPHLTRWQARYRRWYKTIPDTDERDPQEIQKVFPNYRDLTKDLLELNGKLIRYRQMMYDLAMGEQAKHDGASNT